MTYSDKLKNPRWQKKRLEVFNRDQWTCQSCGDSESTLHIHHKVYYPKCNPWDYDISDLITYCAKCHNWEHGIVPMKDNSDAQKKESMIINTRNKIPNLKEIKDHLLKKRKK